MDRDLKERGIEIGKGKGFSMSANDEIAQSLQGTMGYRMGQINPDQLITASTKLTDKTQTKIKNH